MDLDPDNELGKGLKLRLNKDFNISPKFQIIDAQRLLFHLVSLPNDTPSETIMNSINTADRYYFLSEDAGFCRNRKRLGTILRLKRRSKGSLYCLWSN